MQFSAWGEYLIRIVCAVFKIDSSEMGFMFKGSEGKGGEPNMSHKQRTDYSQDKGLVPIMRFYEEILNKWVVMRHTDKYEFAWTGISVEDEDASVDLDIKKSSNFQTIDEIREKRKLPPLPNGKGKVVNNAVWMQFQNMLSMGNPDSNEVVNEENGGSGGSDDGRNLEPDDNNNAFKGINDWIKNGMPSTLEKIN